MKIEGKYEPHNDAGLNVFLGLVYAASFLVAVYSVLWILFPESLHISLPGLDDNYNPAEAGKEKMYGLGAILAAFIFLYGMCSSTMRAVAQRQASPFS